MLQSLIMKKNVHGWWSKRDISFNDISLSLNFFNEYLLKVLTVYKKCPVQEWSHTKFNNENEFSWLAEVKVIYHLMIYILSLHFFNEYSNIVCIYKKCSVQEWSATKFNNENECSLLGEVNGIYLKQYIIFAPFLQRIFIKSSNRVYI